MKLITPEFLRFCIVGVLGFFVDTAGTLGAGAIFGLSPPAARVIGFLLAASATWLLHRSFTFNSGGGLRSWFQYLAATAFGASVNFVTYLAWLSINGSTRLHVVLGIAAGSMVALMVNFAISKRVVFRKSA